MEFRYHPEILTKFPDITGGVILAQDIQNNPSPENLQEEFIAEQQRVKAQIGSTPLSELPTLVAWRQAYRAFGVNPTKYRSACEALLRRLTKKGDIPSINTLVDICNLVSIRYALPVAAFDTRALQGAITVHLADGSENFTPLGEEASEHPEKGEVVFSDDTRLVVARRWCWRQSEESAANLNTRQAIFTVEAQHADSLTEIEGALEDLLYLLKRYAGGEFKSAVLGPDKPALSG